MQIHLLNIWFKLVCQGHRVKVRVTGVKRICMYCSDLNVECLDLERLFSVCRYICEIGQVRI